MNTRLVTIFFDLEGQWGMPFKSEYDLDRTVRNILRVLEKYKYKAVFNTCGVIAKVHPHIIKQIHDHGHEIALHGYVHEHLDNLDVETFEWLLAEAERDIVTITGQRPLGFRAPYLLAPTFYNKAIYKVFSKRGYLWASNRGIRCADEIGQPNRLKRNILDDIARLLHALTLTKYVVGRWLITCILNAKLLVLYDFTEDRSDANLVRQTTKHNIIYKLKWLFKYRTPFYRDRILEIPVLSPLDGDLLNLPNPTINSPQELIDFGTALLKEQMTKPYKYFNLNSHDWIIGTNNRLQMLDALLNEMSTHESIKVILAKDMPELSSALSRQSPICQDDLVPATDKNTCVF
jgi:peptidoglycan/xylan/chitin deacetylase (PgdA/CDA1 family)